MEDKDFMQRCITLGRIAKQRGESPVGSIVVKDGRIIGEGIEGVKEQNDLTSHAEIEAIRTACKDLNSRDLSGCEIYTTHEPCLMCSYVIRQTKISKIVFGIATGELGGYGSEFKILETTSVQKWTKPPEIITGFMRSECENI